MLRQDFHEGKMQYRLRNQVREELWGVFAAESWKTSSQGFHYIMF